MFKHGVFWCRYCAYSCIAKSATETQQRNGMDKIEIAFFEIVEDPRLGVADLDLLD